MIFLNGSIVHFNSSISIPELIRNSNQCTEKRQWRTVWYQCSIWAEFSLPPEL